MTGNGRLLVAAASLLLGLPACGGTDGPESDVPSPTAHAALHREGVPVPVKPGTEALVTALQKQPGPRVSPPVQTTFGGHPTTPVDLKIPEDREPNCRMMGEKLQVWFSRPAPKYLVLLPDTLTSVYVLDLDGERQVFVVMRPEDLPAAERAELQAVPDSIRIGG